VIPGNIALFKSVRETFQKSERLCSRKIITSLFEEGEVFYSPLFKVIWSRSPSAISFPARVAFSVAKKGFRHAVTRNLIKRRMREAYRKNKFILYNFLNSVNMQIVIIIIFRANFIPDFQTIEAEMIKLLNSCTGIIKVNIEKS
jgi:ribonuclease P protein component